MAATLVDAIGETQALLLGVGLLGAFTTMSTFSVETVMMVEDGRWRLAGLYVVVSAVVGPLLAWFGWKGGQHGSLESLQDGQHAVQRQQRAGLHVFWHNDLIGDFTLNQAFQDVHEVGGVNHVHG